MAQRYNTRQKQQISRALMACQLTPMTVDALYERLRSSGCAVGKTTVYRHLERMAEGGEVRKAQSPDGSAVYQYVGDAAACERHLHCQCAVCGQLTHMDCALLCELTDHLLREHGFRLDAGRTVLMGTCDKCGEA